MKRVTPTNPEAAVRILKIASCPSLSSTSSLTYHIGCAGKSDIQLRIYTNDGGGFFNDEWVSLSEILEALNKSPSNKPLNSIALSRLFRGKSTNTPAFLLAALRQEGLARASKDKLRNYERVDPKGFMAEMKSLIDSPVDLKAEGKPTKPVKPKVKVVKPEAKPKPAAPAKKTPSKSSKKKKA